jgi:hypothetical protein
VPVILIDGSWLREGPGLSELVSRIKDLRGKKRSRTAIVIPTWKKNGLMREHVEKLALQEHGGFDAIIVYGEEDEFLEDTCGVPSVHIRPKTNLGSAGGFYIGERFALESGYEYLILSDNDCLPESYTLVRDLLGALKDGADVAFPKIRNADGKEPQANRLLPQYGCMRADVLRDVGLSYLPLHFGGEDHELFERMKMKGYRAVEIGSVAYHAQHAGVSPFACYGLKMRYYLRGEILWRLLRSAPQNAYCHIFMNLFGGIFFAFSRKDLSRVMLDAVRDGASMRFFKIESATGEGPMVEQGVMGIDASRWSMDNRGGDAPAGRFRRFVYSTARYLSQVPGVFRKDIIFDRTVGASGMLLAMLARNSWLRENGNYHPVLKENRAYHLPLHLAMLGLAFSISVPSALVLTGAAYAKMTMLGIDSDSYGL